MNKQNTKKVLILTKKMILLSICLILLTAGCTEMTRTEKNLCYSLSSRSYAYIPACETEKSCFEKVDELFKTNLGYTQESNLYSLKNHLARSWFFYNKATNEAKNISKSCQSGDYSNLAGAINQTKSNIDTSFIELDAALKESFEIISYEEKSLSESKIDLVKEEDLFDSLTQLRQILVELDNNTSSSDSYVAYYRKKVETFNKSNAKKLSEPLVEDIPFWAEGYDYVDGTILKKIGLSKESNFPFISEALQKAMNYLETRFYTTQGLRELQNFPMSDFMKLYSDLGGNNNSAIKRFADLVNKTSKNKENIQKELTSIKKDLSLIQIECTELYAKSKENKEFEKLSEELTMTSISGKTNTAELLLSSNSEYFKLKEKSSRGGISLGEELLTTKDLLNKFNQVKTQLNWELNEINQKLVYACTQKAIEIKKEKLSSTNQNIQNLIEDSLYYATKTQDTNGKEKLGYCEEMVEKNNTLQKALNDYEELEAASKDSAKDCILYLEKVVPNSGLIEIELLFNQLQNTQVTKENLLEFEDNCQNIKKQLNNELNSEKENKELLSLYEELIKILDQLRLVESYSSNNELRNEIENITKKIENYEKYFPNNEIDYSQVILIKSNLREALQSSVYDANNTLIKNIISYAKENYLQECKNNETLVLGERYYCENNIIVPNPFVGISTNFSIEINSDLNKVLELGDCVSEIIKKDSNTTQLIFKCLNYNGSKSIILTNENISTTENDELIYVSNEKSVIKRNILPNTNLSAKKITLKTFIPQNTTNIAVIANGTEINNYFTANNELSFEINNFYSKTEISIVFYVTNLLLTNLSRISSSKNLIKYTAEIENTLAKELDADIILEIPINKIVKRIEIMDEKDIVKKYVLADNKLVIRNETYSPKEKKIYSLLIYVDSEYEYYLEELAQQVDEFNLLEETGLAQQTQLAIENGTENSIAYLKDLVESNQEKINEIELQKETDEATEFMRQELLEKIEELRLLQDEFEKLGLEKEANEYEKIINKVLNYDLNNENNIAKAFDLISTTILSSSNSFVLSAEEMETKINQIKKYESNLELNQLREKFTSTKEDLLTLIDFNPSEAKYKYIDLNKTYYEILFLVELLDTNSNNEAKRMQKEISELYKKSKELLEYLETELYTNENQIIKEKIITPITQSRLKKLELSLDETISSSYPLEQKLSTLQDIYVELVKANEELEKQAIAAYNKGIDLGLNRELLLQGKEFIDSNKYIDALILFSSGSKNNGINFESIPFSAFIPILAIVILALVLKNQFGKKEKEENIKKNLILEEWKE